MSKALADTNISNVLLVTLSNIGDIILTFPVLDQLFQRFPNAKVSVVVGPKGESLFNNHPMLENVIVFDKHQPVSKTIQMVWELRKQKYDLTIDLRNTAIPFLVGSKFKTPFAKKADPDIHMKQKHLNRLVFILDISHQAPKVGLYIPEHDKEFVDGLFKNKLIPNRPIVVMAPGSANEHKRWSAHGFAQVSDTLVQEYDAQIVFVGDEKDAEVGDEIDQLTSSPMLNLCGRTTLLQSAEIIRRSALAIMNDSAPMHLASYLDVPTFGLFAVSNPRQYSPWSMVSAYIESPTKGDIRSIEPEQVIARIFRDEKGFHFSHE